EAGDAAKRPRRCRSNSLPPRRAAAATEGSFMKRIVTSLLFLALMAAGPHAKPAAAPPPAPPATQPAGPRPMPNDYLILLAKSIFASHNQTASKQKADAPPESGLA